MYFSVILVFINVGILFTRLQVELLQCEAFGVQGLFRKDHGATMMGISMGLYTNA
jgi:hypothetical protein